ncbi:MAG: DsrE family protein [Betaproteobacteria bacterium]|jgi:intracellular sulfur oxidation DsrE/DsrF family protein
MERLLMSVAAALAMIGASGCASVSQAPAAQSASAPVRVVYHMTLGLDEAQRGMGNVRNHLAADPAARIVVVGNGNGIEFMLDGAKDRNGNPFDVSVQELKARGVEFRLCNNTLVQRKIDRARVVAEADIVPSGVAEAARLQAREGFVYLRP